MNVRALFAELVGTFILVGAGSLAIVSALIVSSGSSETVLLVVPFGFGLGLLAALAIAGPASGGHFNPAVSLAFVIDGQLDIISGIGYLVAQVLGALAASLMILAVISPNAVAATRTVPGVQDLPAFAGEAILTSIFVAVILTITRTAPRLAVLVIPLTLLMIHFAAIPITGSSVNPARSLAPAIVAGDYSHLWVYLTGPFVGSIVGWVVYRILTPPVGDLVPEAGDLDDIDLASGSGDEELDEEDDFDEDDDEDFDEPRRRRR
jgi:aquaporin Z